MKDNFSSGSAQYSRYRPGYPTEVYEYIRSKLDNTGIAWDCGTGSGQVASKLSEFFEAVEATDISASQLKNATKKYNINYTRQAAENSNFPDNHFDLVTCGQSIHWFDFDRFYKEVDRCLKPGGLIAILGYGLFSANTFTTRIIQRFYKEIIGEYWDEERRYLEEKYKNIPFPYTELPTPVIYNSYEWSIEDLLGYLRTWSAVKHYKKAQGRDPVELIEDELRLTFGSSGQVVFPVLFRLGKITLTG